MFMERQRKIKVLTAIALIVAVFGLTVAFAAMSTTLTINGTANLNAASWDIHFENLQVDETTSEDASINSQGTINGTMISGIDITITKPGDIASLSADIVNNGSIDAKISSVEISPLCTTNSPVSACDWNNDGTVTEEDVQKVNDNISFVVAYYDGTPISENDTLNNGETKKIGLMIAYAKLTLQDGLYILSDESTELPERDLTFDNLSVTINYVQAD